jgi:hypothetical protein
MLWHDVTRHVVFVTLLPRARPPFCFTSHSIDCCLVAMATVINRRHIAYSMLVTILCILIHQLMRKNCIYLLVLIGLFVAYVMRRNAVPRPPDRINKFVLQWGIVSVTPSPPDSQGNHSWLLIHAVHSPSYLGASFCHLITLASKVTVT